MLTPTDNARDSPLRHQRLFVGLAVPDDIARTLAQQARQTHPAPGGVHWVAAANYHLTLCYLGTLPTAALPPLATSLHYLAMGIASFGLRLGHICRFPDTRGHILAAIPDHSEPLHALHRQLMAQLKTLGIQSGDAGAPYRPHITLARYRRSTRDPGDIHQVLTPAHDYLARELRLYQGLSLERKTIYRTLAEASFRP